MNVVDLLAMEFFVPVDLLLGRCQLGLEPRLITIKSGNKIAQGIVQLLKIFCSVGLIAQSCKFKVQFLHVFNEIFLLLGLLLQVSIGFIQLLANHF